MRHHVDITRIELSGNEAAVDPLPFHLDETLDSCQHPLPSLEQWPPGAGHRKPIHQDSLYVLDCGYVPSRRQAISSFSKCNRHADKGLHADLRLVGVVERASPKGAPRSLSSRCTYVSSVKLAE